MNKIPVGKTVADAYGFAFGRFFGNLGVVWVPGLVIILAAWFAVPTGFGAWTKMMTQIGRAPAQSLVFPPGLLAFYQMALLFWVAIFLLRTEIMLGLMRRALGLSTGPSLIFLSVGKSYWRLAGSYFAATIILWAIQVAITLATILAGLVVAAVVGIGAHGDKADIALGAGAGIALAVVFVLGATLYVAVRLLFLLTPAVVAADRFDIGTGWRLARGSVLRIVLICLVVLVPISILIGVVALPVYFGVLWPLPHLPLDRPDMPAVAAEVSRWTSVLLERAARVWYVVVPLGLASSALIYGALAGAMASAYRAVAPAAQPQAERAVSPRSSGS